VSSSLRRGALAAAAIAFSIASLAACAAGNNAQTLEIKPDNAATTVGVIKVQNALVITQPDSQSTGPAVISATLFNSGTSAQTLDAITVAGVSEPAKLAPAKGKGKLTVPAGGSLVLGGEGNASAVLSGSREGLKDGAAQKVTFSFSKTGDVSLQAFIVPAKSYFEKWGPTEVPSAPAETSETSPSPTESATGSATPSGEASASVSASESAAQ
jgi:copper(I)-binding protein